MLKEKIKKAETILEVLPYIKAFHGETVVIKYGGSIMVDAELKKDFAQDIVLLKYVGMNPVIVHGGGKEISKWMERMGKESVFIDGLRVTDGETMEITEMVLSGKINNEIVSMINEQGGKAVGLSGKDANLISAKKRNVEKGKDLGLVGHIEKVDTSLITTLSKNGYIPVLSTVGQNREEGGSLNMNADHVAQELAVALSALKLIFLTDIKGVMIEEEVKSVLTLEQAKKIVEHRDVKGGMKVKLSSSIEAVDSGVGSAHIINGNIDHVVLLELFTDVGIGTMIKR